MKIKGLELLISCDLLVLVTGSGLNLVFRGDDRVTVIIIVFVTFVCCVTKPESKVC